jgi:hypothetical protein
MEQFTVITGTACQEHNDYETTGSHFFGIGFSNKVIPKKEIRKNGFCAALKPEPLALLCYCVIIDIPDQLHGKAVDHILVEQIAEIVTKRGRDVAA